MTARARRVAAAARRAAVTAAALDRLRELRPRLEGQLTERDELLIAAALTDDEPPDTGGPQHRPIPHAHV